MEEYFEIISVPAITAIAYSLIAMINYAVKANETFKRFIPLISTGIGVVLGIVAFYAIPDIMPAENVFVAIIIGGASGLSATGIHQAIKQLGKADDKQEQKENKTDEEEGPAPKDKKE